MDGWILALLGLALFGSAFGSEGESASEAEDVDAPDQPDPTSQTPDEEPDIGATFVVEDDGSVTIERGEDETGTLATFVYVNTEDSEENFYETYEARYYLVPEDVTLPDNDWDARFNIPGQDQFEGPNGTYEIDDLEQTLGLTLLGQIDLGVENIPTRMEGAFTISGDFEGVVGDDLPPLKADQPASVFYVEAQTDGDEIILFLPEDYVVTQNGVARMDVTEDTNGTSGSDWLYTEEDGLTLNGLAGDDVVEGAGENATVRGGAGDDTLAVGLNGVAEGGAGDDRLNTTAGNATLFGGEGDDNIFAGSSVVYAGTGNDNVSATGGDVPSTVFLGEGDDSAVIRGEGSEGFGGLGSDTLNVTDGASAFGQSGNDTLNVDAGGFGDGGDGDDEILVWEFHNQEEGAATVTGGAGADTFDIKVRNGFNGRAETDFVVITDFDPEVDTLQIGEFQSDAGITDVQLIEAEDGSHTDIEVTYGFDDGRTPGTAVIRLEGVTNLDPTLIELTD